MLQHSTTMNLEQCELGKNSTHNSEYDPTILFTIPRAQKRAGMGIAISLPFVGFDIWNHYEVSWLNEKGKPIVAIAEITYPCESDNIIESKSMKLYFNSLNNTKFNNIDTLKSTISADLSAKVGMSVLVQLVPLSDINQKQMLVVPPGICIDNLDIECTRYTTYPDYLTTEDNVVEECLCSNLLKSNCLVTNQPDWASIQIQYKGQKINREGLLQYLVSFRNHNDFHEQCIEQIFVDIMKHCKPKELSVYGRYTRRGGLDINVYRGTIHISPFENNQRQIRQ